MQNRHLDDLRELQVALVAEADIAGVDAIFVERLGAAGMIGQELVPDVMEVADQRHRHAELGEPLLDARHGGGRLVAVDRDAHQFRAGTRQRRHLARGALHVGGVGIGHRLHDDRRAAADHDAADIDRNRMMTFLGARAHRGFSGHRSARVIICGQRARFTSTRPPATSATAAAKAGVSGSPSTRWPAATPNKGVRNVKAESRLAE